MTCAVALVICPIPGLVFPRYSLLFAEPVVNLLTFGEAFGSEDAMKETLAIFAWFAAVILIFYGSAFHSVASLVSGVLLFTAYGIAAPSIFSLKLESDSEKGESEGGVGIE